jgi:hypothetical protein
MGVVVAFVAEGHGVVCDVFVGFKTRRLPLPLKDLLGLNSNEFVCAQVCGLLLKRIPHPAICKRRQRQCKRLGLQQVFAKKGVELLKTVVAARNNRGKVLQAVAQLYAQERLQARSLRSARKSQARTRMIDVGEQQLRMAILLGPQYQFFGLEYAIA